MRQYLVKLLFGLLSFFVAGAGISGAVSANREAVPLQGNLGKYQYPVSTAVPKAQRYFDQGLILSFGFNHAEAARSFREAARLDPKCAICFWGEALVLGPNINAPMSDSAVPLAYAAVQKAWSLASHATKKEKALIQALIKRYGNEIVIDRSHLDAAYAEAMCGVYQQFPDDAVIGSLLAEALMDLHPWDYWKKTGEAQPWTSEIVSILEGILEKTPNQPLANHLYIHAIEGSPHPEKALPNAERLATLVPGSGHLVHMPAHIYLRVGRYRDAALANQQAVKVDQHYLSHSHVESVYTAAYIPHNYHFLWAAAAKTGQHKLALQAARDTAAKINPMEMREPGFSGTLQHFSLMPLYTQALFGQWREILTEPEPPMDLLYVRGIWHYARGLALLRQGIIDSAQLELTHLQQIVSDPAVVDLKIFDVNEISQILEIAHAVLEGEISAAQLDYDVAIENIKTCGCDRGRPELYRAQRLVSAAAPSVGGRVVGG